MRFFVESTILVTTAVLFGDGPSLVDALLLSSNTNTAAIVRPSTSSLSSTNSIYEGLSTTALIRASDQKLVTLPSLWRSKTPFGIADETAVCALLRHYG
mmetsp:Transcript_25497/g.28547  ORF Transcript_25497/g.28547 Transcript_25497/m.28547 type:complete len:99 (-) Transcript_25497:834-1130(-)